MAEQDRGKEDNVVAFPAHEHSDRELLVRIDERTKALAEKVDAFHELFVTKDDFAPIKRVVYGCVALVLAGVVTAAVTVVLGTIK